MKSFITCLTLATFIVCCHADGSDGPPHGPPFLRDVSIADLTKCLDEAGLTKDDLKALHDSPMQEPTAKQLCLAKCVATAAGFIDKDGMIVSDLIKKNAPSDIDDDTVKSAIACMVAAGKISTCDDISKILKCLPKPPKKTK